MRGYTLLELLIVLLLLGLMAGFALPRLDSLLSSTRSAYQLEDILVSVAGLGAQALSEGREYHLTSFSADADTQHPLQLPSGWHLETDVPVIYRSNGTCLGGQLRLIYAGQSTAFDLQPPFCQPRR